MRTVGPQSRHFKAVAGLNFLLLTSYGIVLYLTVNWLHHTPLLKARLWLALTVTGTLTHLISLAFWRPNRAMWISGDFYTAIRNALPLGHHNFVGGYCLLLLPLVTGICIYSNPCKTMDWLWRDRAKPSRALCQRISRCPLRCRCPRPSHTYMADHSPPTQNARTMELCCTYLTPCYGRTD